MKTKKSPTCHPDRPHVGKGLCRKCYIKQWHNNRKHRKAKCHPSRTDHAKGLCFTCYNINRLGREQYLAKAAKRQVDYVHRLKNSADKSKYEKLRASGRLSTYKTTIKRKYGITLVEVSSMLEAQEGKCALCRRAPDKGRKLSVDHNHKTGKVRGMLCITCNSFLSRVDADASVVERILPYVSK